MEKETDYEVSHDEKVIKEAKEVFERIANDMKLAHDVGHKCRSMVSGGESQHDPDDLKIRKDKKRPAETYNQLQNFVNLVTNRAIQDKKIIEVAAFENGDTELTEVINGLLLHIQNSDISTATTAFQKAFRDLITCGFGYYRIRSKYPDSRSFNQEIVFEPIEDCFSVFKDEDHCIVLNIMSKADFKRKYKIEEDKFEGIEDWHLESDYIKKEDGEVCVFEYWVKEYTPIKIYQIRIPEHANISQEEMIVAVEDEIVMDNVQPPEAEIIPEEVQIVTGDELKALQKEMALFGTEIEVITERDSEDVKVKQYILSKSKIIKEVDYDGDYIPIIMIHTEKSYTLKDEYFYKGLVYDGIGPQVMLNYWVNQTIEFLKMQTKTPYIGPKGSFDGLEYQYEEAAVENRAYIEYNPKTISGQMVGPPQRQQPPVMSSGYMQGIQLNESMLKSCIGLFEANLGMGNAPERSGKAIGLKVDQGNLATSHFIDAFNIGLLEGGKVCIDLIPKKYDTERMVRILGKDMTEKVVKINGDTLNEDGEIVKYDISNTRFSDASKYDLKLKTAMNGLTRRQERAESLLEFMRTIPNAAPLLGGMVAESLDMQDAKEVSYRLEAAVDPQVLARVKQIRDEREGKGPSQEQIQIQKMGMAIKQMQMQVQQSQNVIKQLTTQNNVLKSRIDGSRVQVAQVNQQGGIQKEQIRRDTELKKEQISIEGDLIKEKVKKIPPFPQMIP